MAKLAGFKSRKRKIILWAPVFVQMALIFFFSAQAPGSSVLDSFPLSAAAGHMLGYGLLALLLYRAFNGGIRGWRIKAARYTFITGIIYAVSDELHQAFVPGRQAALADIFIDAAGIMLALGLVRISALPAVDKRLNGIYGIFS
jgi:VanZ family protein